jgi:glutathione S-transferase
MSPTITLYTNPRSRGCIARWMLEECGAGYDVQVLEYGTSTVITETAAICAATSLPLTCIWLCNCS